MPDVFEENNQTNAKPPEPGVAQAPSYQKSGKLGLFTSFSENPEGVSFQNQEEGEKIILFIRKDFITNIGWLVTGAFLLLLPLVVFLGQQFLFSKYTLISIPVNLLLTLFLFYYLFTLTYLFISFITWYFNISLITDRRVVDIDFSSLVYKNIAVTKLDLVQDVSYKQVGVMRTFFDYGNVLVQTAGTIDNFEFDSAPNPEEIVHIVEDLIGKNE